MRRRVALDQVVLAKTSQDTPALKRVLKSRELSQPPGTTYAST
jgi:hypothetical protein